MGWLDTLIASSSGMTAQRLRMDVYANNLANAETTRTPGGGPYRRRDVLLSARAPFGDVLAGAMSAGSDSVAGVRVDQVVEDQSPFKLKYDPTNPDADKNGYVNMPNVDTVIEMTNMIAASRAYEANVTAMNAFKTMEGRALEIGR